MGWLRKLLGLNARGAKRSYAEDFVAELSAEQSRLKEAGSVEGAHYTDHVERLKQLKREKRHSEAIDLLLKLVDATESEARAAGRGWGVAP